MTEDPPARPAAEYATDRYGVLFLELVVLFSLTALLEQSRFVRAIQGGMVLLVVITSLRSSGVPPRRLRALSIGAALGTVALLLASIYEGRTLFGIISIAIGLILGFGVFAIVRRIFEHERVTLQEVVAALAAYLQLALLFAFVDSGVASLGSAQFFAEGPTGLHSDFLYFSVVTITTLGYGDLTPATDVGRTLAMIETLFGQIFLVVLIAYLVSSLGSRRRRLRKP